jgi:hypothetical protein
MLTQEKIGEEFNKIFKPSEFTTRQMDDSIQYLENTTPYFSRQDMIHPSSLSWKLLGYWYALFLLHGYPSTIWVVTFSPRSKTILIEACEAIQRNEVVLENPKNKVDTSDSYKMEKRDSDKARSSSEKGKRRIFIQKKTNSYYNRLYLWVEYSNKRKYSQK